MKKLNKKIFMITIISVMFLGGCDNTNNSENISGDTNETSLIEAESRFGSTNESISAENDYIYVKQPYNIYETGMITGYEAKNYLSFDSMEKTVLCTKPNCNHKNLECTAKMIGDTPIIYNDHIYYFTPRYDVNETPDGPEFYIDISLNRVSLANSEVEKVTGFTYCVPREEDGCLIKDDVMYFCGDDMNPVVDDYGNISYSDVGGKHYFCSIDLKTGDFKNYGSIYDEDKKYDAASNSSTAKVRGFYNSKIYIEYSFLKEMIPDSAYNDSLEPRDYFTVLNFEFDLSSQILSESKLLPPSYMDSDTYVYSNFPENSSVVIDKGKTYTFDGVDVGIYGRVFNEKLFMYDWWYDITNSSKHSYGEYEGWEVMTVYDDCYILMNDSGTDFVKLTGEELLAL